MLKAVVLVVMIIGLGLILVTQKVTDIALTNHGEDLIIRMTCDDQRTEGALTTSPECTRVVPEDKLKKQEVIRYE